MNCPFKAADKQFRWDITGTITEVGIGPRNRLSSRPTGLVDAALGIAGFDAAPLCDAPDEAHSPRSVKPITIDAISSNSPQVTNPLNPPTWRS